MANGQKKKENIHLKQINPTWFRIVRVFSLVWKLYSKHAFLSCFFPLFFSVFLFFQGLGFVTPDMNRITGWNLAHRSRAIGYAAHRRHWPHVNCDMEHIIHERSSHTACSVHSSHTPTYTHAHALSQSQYGLRWASLFDRVCFRALSHTSHSCSLAFHTAEVPGRIFKHSHELKDTIFDVRVKFGCF